MVSEYFQRFTHHVLLRGPPVTEGWQDEHDLAVGDSKVNNLLCLTSVNVDSFCIVLLSGTRLP